VVTSEILKDPENIIYRPLDAAGTDEIVYAGQGGGTGWEGMMDEEHEKG